MAESRSSSISDMDVPGRQSPDGPGTNYSVVPDSEDGNAPANILHRPMTERRNDQRNSYLHVPIRRRPVNGSSTDYFAVANGDSDDVSAERIPSTAAESNESGTSSTTDHAAPVHQTIIKSGLEYSVVSGGDNGNANMERASWFPRLILDTWVPEIIAMTMSVLCLAAILGVLIAYHGEPAPSMPLGITLNAVVAILATTSRTSLLYVVTAAVGQLKWSWYKTGRRLQDIQTFDDASRGPWGSLNLLFSLHARPLAAIGALVTVLALAYDPFVQQILSFPTRLAEAKSIAAPETSKVPLFLYRDFYEREDNDGWQQAVDQGVWTVDTSVFERRPRCPVEFCEWNITNSIGWCSECQDALPYAKLSNCNTSSLWEQSYNASKNDPVTGCTVSYGHGFSADLLKKDQTKLLGKVINEMVWALDGLDLDPLDPANSHITPSAKGLTNASYLGVHSPVIALGHVKANVRHSTEGPFTMQMSEAQECVLSLCTIDSHITVSNGTVSVEEYKKSFGSMYYRKQSNRPDGNYSARLETTDACWKRDSRADLTDTKSYVPGLSGLNRSVFCPDKYWFNESSHDWTPAIANAITGHHFENRWLVGRQTLEYAGDPFSVPAMKAVAREGLGHVLAGMAASLTRFGLSANPTEQVQGSAKSTQTFINVNYYWLIYPLALEIGGIILLTVAIVWSSRYDVRLWKSSILPFLYFGVDADLLVQRPAPETISAMNWAAKGVHVQMVAPLTGSRSMLKEA